MRFRRRDRNFAGRIAIAVLFCIALAPRGARADAISDILSRSEVRLNLKPAGQAVGSIQGVQDGEIQMVRRGGIKFSVALSSVADTPDQLLAEARRLVGEGKFRRAAIQFGIARVLDSQKAGAAQLEPAILQGLANEVKKVTEFRQERVQSEADTFRQDARKKAAAACPKLCRFLTATPPFFPNSKIARVPDLQGWDALTKSGGGPAGQFRLARQAGGDSASRLSALSSMMTGLPESAALVEKARDEAARSEAAVQLFLRAAGALWTDYWNYLQYRADYARKYLMQGSPMDQAREKARDLLKEQLVPSSRSIQVRVGNVMEEQKQPIPQDPQKLKAMEPRIEAPFIEETRKGEGIQFITSAGDQAFVRIDDWKAFDNPPKPPASPEAGFAAAPRPGLEQFKKEAEALIVAWAAAPEDPDLMEAMKRLEQDASAVFRSEPGLPAVSEPIETPVSTPRPTPTPPPTATPKLTPSPAATPASPAAQGPASPGKAGGGKQKAGKGGGKGGRAKAGAPPGPQPPAPAAPEQKEEGGGEGGDGEE